MSPTRIRIVRSTLESVVLGLTLIVGVALWCTGGPSDSKEAARPLIDALEQYHRTHGRFPDSLETLLAAKLLRTLPRPTSNLTVQHLDRFEYWVDQDLDYYCLAYAEAPIFGGIGPAHWDQVSYISFRGAWDDAPGVPRFNLFLLPVERAGERFRRSRSSADLRLVVRRVGGAAPEGCSIVWDDVAAGIGTASPCTIEGRSGLILEGDDQEAAAFFFVTRRARTARGDNLLITNILERFNEGDDRKWREVFRDGNEYIWLDAG
jgi:hypothetical protein